MYAIVGAGPAGLYLAIKLHQAGVRDIVIYDARAGTYTRPGHLNYQAYLHGLGATLTDPLRLI